MKIYIDTNTFPATPGIYADAEKTKPLPRVIPLVQGFRGTVQIAFLGELAPKSGDGVTLAMRPFGARSDILVTQTVAASTTTGDDGVAAVAEINLAVDTSALVEALGPRETMNVLCGVVVTDDAAAFPTRVEWQLVLSVSASALDNGVPPDISPSAAEQFREDLESVKTDLAENYVTKNTAQEISEVKTFTKGVRLSGANTVLRFIPLWDGEVFTRLEPTKVQSSVGAFKRLEAVDVTGDALTFDFPLTSGMLALRSDIAAADANVVHKAGMETITGEKEFTVSPKIQRDDPFLVFINTGITKGTPPAESKYLGLRFVDKNGDGTVNGMATIQNYYTTNGESVLSLRVFNPVNGSTVANGIKIVYPKGGTPYIEGITPPTGDNSVKLATTAWVTAFGNGKFLPLAGGTVTANLNVGKTAGRGAISVLPLGTKTAMGMDAYGLHVSAMGGLQLFGTHFLRGDIWTDNSLKIVANNVSLYSTDEAAIGFDYANKVIFRTMPNDGTEATYSLEAWQWDNDSHSSKSPSAGVKLLKPSQKTALEPNSVLNMEEGDARWKINPKFVTPVPGDEDTTNDGSFGAGFRSSGGAIYLDYHEGKGADFSIRLSTLKDLELRYGDYVHKTGAETISGLKSFTGGIRVSSIASVVGTPIYDTTAAKGFNFKGIYTLGGYVSGGSAATSVTFFKQENPTTNWIDVTTLKEGGVAISEKYALSSDLDKYVKTATGENTTTLVSNDTLNLDARFRTSLPQGNAYLLGLHLDDASPFCAIAFSEDASFPLTVYNQYMPITFPAKSGTVALTSDLADYVPKSDYDALLARVEALEAAAAG